jgi:hypothetical protein
VQQVRRAAGRLSRGGDGGRNEVCEGKNVAGTLRVPQRIPLLPQVAVSTLEERALYGGRHTECACYNQRGNHVPRDPRN